MYHCRLGGNPCCSIVTSKNPTPYQQQNCRYNSSTIPIGGDIHQNNFPTFQRLIIHGKVKDCALHILHLQYTRRKAKNAQNQNYHLSLNIHVYCFDFHYPITMVSTY